MLYIGSHVSMAAPEYLLGSVKEALSYGANALMIYTGAPQNTVRKNIEDLRVSEALQLMDENNIKHEHMIVHAPYIINLANTTKPSTFELATSFLKIELDRVKAIKAKYLVLHPGNHVQAGEEAGLEQVIKGLNQVLRDDHEIIICLETMAGKGSEVGYTFEQIKYIMDHVNKNHLLGVCLDTCHICDAGYDIVNDLDGVLTHFDEVIGLDKLHVVHVNDSKNACGAKKDRHANIGCGHIGFETLNKIVHHPLLDNKVKILETPWYANKPPYKKEIAMLREQTFQDNFLEEL
jgi:deoxyribonuclease IV